MRESLATLLCTVGTIFWFAVLVLICRMAAF